MKASKMAQDLQKFIGGEVTNPMLLPFSGLYKGVKFRLEQKEKKL